MNSIRYSLVKCNSLKCAFLVIGLLCLSSILLAQEPWTQIVDMNVERGYCSSSVVNGKIYAVGGGQTPSVITATMEVYDTATNTWTMRESLDISRLALTTCVVDEKIYAFGGVTGAQWTSIDTVEAYDPGTDTWTKKKNMPTARGFLASCVLDGKIYVIGGGTDIFSTLSIAEVYDPITDTWDTTKASMPTDRISLSTCVVEGKIYAIGGASVTGNNWNALGTMEVYDPVTDTWDTTKNPMPTPRHSLSTSVVDGKIYAIGGQDSTDLNTVEMYDPITDSWILKTSMPTARRGLATSVLNDTIYVIGGTYGYMKPGIQTVELYDPASDWFHSQNAHGEAIMVHPKYVAPQTETLIVKAQLYNPQQHSVMVYAMIQSDDHSYQDSLEMFDDGLHDDENVGDGIWGVK